jgi:hypothetical protein
MSRGMVEWKRIERRRGDGFELLKGMAAGQAVTKR